MGAAHPGVNGGIVTSKNWNMFPQLEHVLVLLHITKHFH